MANNDDAIKKILNHAKPDEAMMLEGIRKANETITLLSNELTQCSARSQQYWAYLVSIMHKFGGELVIAADEKITLDPVGMTLTVEPLEDGSHRLRLDYGRADSGKDN